MSLNLLYVPRDNDNQIYRSKNEANFLVRSATEADDEQLVQLIAETMPSNGMILAFERYPSYLAASHAQYNRPDIKLVVPEENPAQVVGMMNLGRRDCFINGQAEGLRYVADLRLHPMHRGNKVLRLLMDYVYDSIPLDTIFESVVLEDNTVACNILHHQRKGFPLPFHYDDIRTFTVSQAEQPKQFAHYRFQQMNSGHVGEANTFIRTMKQHYNFLPNYDFSGLAESNHPFWLGMNIQDFYIMYDQHNQVIGLYGLWNQKPFKQTRVVDYSRPLKLIKPFYNLYAGMRGVLSLPKKNDAFEYLMIHSALCHPEKQGVFASLIFHAKQQTKLRRKQAFCITLANKDPRIHWMRNTTSHVIQAKHYFHSFKANPYDVFDHNKISYFEVGRI
ncbi:MAG: N-acetyltransferase family protein [Acinetobacter sp.]